MKVSQLLAAMRETREFQAIAEELNHERPAIPVYRPGNTIEDEERSIRQLKYMSALREGWDLLFSQLTGRKP